MPLLRNIDKSKISKRKNPVSLIYYQQAGYLPEAMINFLGLMGGGMPADINNGTEKFTLDEMVEHFVFTDIRVGGPVFDLAKLKWLNGEYLRAMTPEAFFAAVRERVFGDEYLRGISALMQPRIETLGQFGDLTGFFFSDDVTPSPEVFLPRKRTLEETLAYAQDQLAVIEAADWSHDALDAALRKLGEEKSWSVKENFMLLRAIVTGSTMSPPLLDSMILFGKARTLDRVRRFLDAQKKLGTAKK
ncbi:MAG: glutamate--tRNA ligase family protein, partial [Acidobacteriaceae bacterium]|nr:glutamate--tRNA ligase family protein [Acidobacteriaceae bacterium]